MQDCNTTVIGGNSTVINNYYNNVPLDHLSKIVIEEIPVIARWLTTTNYLKIHRDVLRKRTPNTLRWFFVIPEFEAWLNSEGGILWGTGIPGAGKTVLSSAIIDFLLKMEQQSQKRICVLFMYCRYTEPIPVKDILAALVKQLLERYSSLVWQFIKPFYDHHQESGTSPSQQDLLDLLQQISNSGVFSMSYYVIDGLDEAPGDVQIDIISAFNSMGINFCLTSRPIDSLKEYVPRAVYVNIVVKNPDVLLLIEQRVERMPALRRLLKDPAVKQEVVSAILSKSSGMFLLVSLQLDAVRDCLSVKDLRDALATLPNGVKDMYAATIARISSQANAHLARRVLLWVTHAQRPLLAQELRYAIATCPQTRKFEAERLVDEDFLLSLSCGLVILDPESRQVRLIREFWLKYYRSIQRTDQLCGLPSKTIPRGITSPSTYRRTVQTRTPKSHQHVQPVSSNVVSTTSSPKTCPQSKRTSKLTQCWSTPTSTWRPIHPSATPHRLSSCPLSSSAKAIRCKRIVGKDAGTTSIDCTSPSCMMPATCWRGILRRVRMSTGRQFWAPDL
ncbi:hypothetical protein FA15DRAFT_274980 [Coprinopsis marcescibilis]|uniref:Nephrocystin 3-like N-terminal domain-containing protein n=1 Tax=Coprinopsis marcescibilis TaxID=230819 RepID=A0A5C3KDM6_COPMA|nr:hypothetical protein FA15DRAFT_274980 [Coprinopsis marcescibilis]